MRPRTSFEREPGWDLTGIRIRRPEVVKVVYQVGQRDEGQEWVGGPQPAASWTPASARGEKSAIGESEGNVVSGGLAEVSRVDRALGGAGVWSSPASVDTPDMS